jgi:hypothetical protein
LRTGHSARTSIPFVSIENHAGDGGPFARFVYSDKDWERSANILISRAAIVIMLYLGMTPGVVLELELLRRAGAQSRTLLLVGDKTRVATTSWMAPIPRMLAEISPDNVRSAPPVDPPPPDFPYVLQLAADHPDGNLRQAIDDLLTKAKARRLPPDSTQLSFPPPFRPDQSALDEAHRIAVTEFDQAVEYADAGDLVAAEDALMRSIAFSHWARDPLGRLTAYTLLAGVERKMGYPNEAVDTFFLALGLAEALAPTASLAAELRPTLADQLAGYLDELGDASRAATVRARATPVP